MGIRRFRGKLNFIFILLIGISVLSAGLFTANKLKQSHIESLKNSMYREIQIIVATVPWREEGTLQSRINYFAGQADLLKDHAEARVTFIDPEGMVLGDSDQDAEQMENHLDRPEIQQALESEKVGSSSRYSSTVNAELLYVAVPLYIDDNKDELLGYVRLSMPLDEIEAYIRGLWSYMITGLLVLFIVAAFVSYRVAQGMTRPLDKIMQVAGQITQMNYKARVESTTQDELGQLGKAINKMAMSLEHQMERIQENESRLKSVLDNMIIGVLMIDKEERITLVNPAAEDMLGFTHKELHGRQYDLASQQIELTQIIQEGLDRREYIKDEIVFYFPHERIIEVNLVPVSQPDGQWGGLLVALHDISDVRRLERMRSEFVANVSHELKTPIAAVKGFAETLLAGAMNDPETAKSFLQIIYDESGRLDRLIVDILELSKIESKRIPLNFSPVHLSEFASKTMEMMRSEANKKQISLSMQVSDTLYLEADEDRLRQILINLLSNGINYTPSGGSVRIQAEALRIGDEEKIRIAISDTGIGIPKKDLPRIFERFYRVDKARSRSSGGTGLGLSIVKHLVELHKGTIQVESKQALGTTFIIELPVLHV